VRAALTLKGWPSLATRPRGQENGGLLTELLGSSEGALVKPACGGHSTKRRLKWNIGLFFFKCPRLVGLESSFFLRIPKALVFVLEGMEFLNGVKGTERVASKRI
jgi:hypothetical protein